MMNYAPSLKQAAAAELELRRRRAPAPVYWPEARPNQRPPEGDWLIWLLLGGRGFGKTRTIVEWGHYMARIMPGSRGHIVGATAADTRDILIDGESGFMNAITESERPRHEPSKRRLTWSNDSVATLFSADEPNRFRGPQSHWAIADEVCAWRYPDAWDQLLLGLRLGQKPRIAVATTPRPTKLIRSLINDPTCHVTRGTTYDNRANLAPSFFDQVIRRYEGSRLGRQELNAEILDDIEGALWTYATMDRNRVASPPELVRVVVGVDPKTSSEADSETGIIVAGKGTDEDVYILEDCSINDLPDAWARSVVNAYTRHQADRIIAEANQGGDMVTSVLRTVDRNISITPVWASRGKQTRAEPIAALYEQGRVHHVGALPQLEDQMCTWVPGAPSPDRMDALVWAVTALMGSTPAQVTDNPFYV
jgi:phage terminase large subunit-like protein